MAGASTAFSAGEYVNSVDVKVSNGSLTVGVKTDDTNNWTIFDNFQIFYLGSISADDLSAGDDCTSLYVTNPGFENGDATGWTISSNNDTGVYSTSNSTYATIGSTGSYLLNNWWTGTPLTQNIGTLPAGAYLLTADVATGNSASEVGTLYLNANNNYSTGYVSSNNKIFGTERLAFYADGSTDVTIGLRGGEDATINADGSVTKGAVNESGYWWYKTDNFTMTYLGNTADELASYLSTLAVTNAPYSDISADDDPTDYTTYYNIYSAYTSGNTITELVTAINYIVNEYDDYCWANASVTHPVELTDDIISGADCTSNDSWPGSGRTTATGTYYDGTSRTYFTQNHETGAARSQSVTILYEGAYLLRTIVRPVAAASYATISISDQSTTTSGIQTGDANIGNGWAYNDVYFFESGINQATTISINLSNANSSREADCGEMHLYYIGRNVDTTKDGVHSYYGNYATAPALELTDDVPVVDVTNATFTSGSSTVTFTNPNGLVFVSDDAQTLASKNEVIGTTCATLSLEDGHPFINPTSFTATSATYTLSALADGKFATLILPFTATAPSGTAYALDQGIDLLDGNVYGTSTSIAANTPVLVTAAGDYTGSSVTVSAVTSGTTYTNGELVGVYQATTAPASSYVLQNHTSRGVAFYLVGSTQPTVNPFRAYIKAQSSNVKAINVVFDEDGIETLSDEAVKGKVEIFNLAGQRLSQLQRGVNIINGKKVVMK